jgi:hypothetical protein
MPGKQERDTCGTGNSRDGCTADCCWSLSCLCSLAELKATQGDSEGAGLLSRRIRSNLVRSGALAQIAVKLAKSGATEEARRLFADAVSVASDPIRSTGMISVAKEEIASLQTECGFVDDAIAVVLETWTPGERAGPLARILRVAAKSRGLAETKKIRARIDDRSLDPLSYGQRLNACMAIAHIRAGDLAAGNERAKEATWWFYAQEIGEAFLEARAWEMAAALGTRIVSNPAEPFKHEGWKLVALARIGEGDFLAAGQAIDRLRACDSGGFSWGEAVHALAAAHATSGDFAGAKRLAEGLGAWDRCFVAQAVARAIVK